MVNGHEIWKDIPNYEGLYQVSSLGNIKSLSRKMWNGYGFFNSKEKNLKPYKDLHGYYFVILYKEKKSKILRVHKLVAMAFLNHNPNECKLVVDHINCNPPDNRVENLQIITQRENSSKDKKNKTSKYTGVSWCKSSNKWKVSIRINDKNIHLGCYDCELKGAYLYRAELLKIKNI
jgi:hypothetical protein